MWTIKQETKNMSRFLASFSWRGVDYSVIGHVSSFGSDRAGDGMIVRRDDGKSIRGTKIHPGMVQTGLSRGLDAAATAALLAAQAYMECGQLKAPTVKQKLEALKKGVELPVSARALAYVSDPRPDEKACLMLAKTYQRKEEGPQYTMVTWANQEKACAFFNEHGLSETLDEIVRIGGPEALS